MGRTTFYMLEQEQKRKEEKKKVEKQKEIDYEEEIKQYHKGGGYYDIPGIDETIHGKEKAIEKLKEGE